MGEFAKKSLDRFPNSEIIELWERLFRSLLNETKNDFRDLQFEIEKKLNLKNV